MIIYQTEKENIYEPLYHHPQLIRLHEAAVAIRDSDTRPLTDEESGDIGIVVSNLLCRIQELTHLAQLKIDGLQDRDLSTSHTDYHDLILTLSDLRRCVEDMFQMVDDGDGRLRAQFEIDQAFYGSYKDRENLGWVTVFRLAPPEKYGRVVDHGKEEKRESITDQ